MQNLFDLSFVIVIGKGGVGRTTISVALALAAARRGKRVLIAMCNSKERLSHMLEVDSIGPHIQSVLPDIEAVNMEPSVALEEYGMMILKVRALYKLILENRFVNAFLRGTPGLDAWAMLGKAQYHVRQKGKDGSQRYDMVILDAPATGHGLDLLRVPRVIIDAAPPGLLRREAEEAWGLFADPNRTGMCLVTIPEELPTNETIELYTVLVKELKLPVQCLMVNGVLPQLFTERQKNILDKICSTIDINAPIHSVVNTARTRALREEIQHSCIERLKQSIPVQHLKLPFLFVPTFRRSALQTVSQTIDNAL